MLKVNKNKVKKAEHVMPPSTFFYILHQILSKINKKYYKAFIEKSDRLYTAVGLNVKSKIVGFTPSVLRVIINTFHREQQEP